MAVLPVRCGLELVIGHYAATSELLVYSGFVQNDVMCHAHITTHVVATIDPAVCVSC